MGTILTIIALFIEIMKLIMSRKTSHAERVALVSRARAARKKAVETGDTSDLEKLRVSLLSSSAD